MNVVVDPKHYFQQFNPVTLRQAFELEIYTLGKLDVIASHLDVSEWTDSLLEEFDIAIMNPHKTLSFQMNPLDNRLYINNKANEANYPIIAFQGDYIEGGIYYEGIMAIKEKFSSKVYFFEQKRYV